MPSNRAPDSVTDTLKTPHILGRQNKFVLSPWLYLLLIALVLLLVAVTRLRVPDQLLDFVVIQRDRPATLAADSPAAMLDDLLLKNRRQLIRHPLVRNALLTPSREVEVQPFWLDQCGVRQGDFYSFVEWQRLHPHRAPPESNQPPNWNYTPANRNHRILGRIDAPANGIDYYGASAYCQAVGGRLPSLDEYQAATTGANGNLYPWGNQPNAQFWPYLDPVLNAAQKCQSQPQAATPASPTTQPLHDLGHGVLEWVHAPPSLSFSTLMGGGVEDKPHDLYALNFINRTASKASKPKYAGFRCAYPRDAASLSSNAQRIPKTTPWGARAQAIAVPAGRYSLGPPSGAKVVDLLKVTQPVEWLTLLNLFSKGEDAKPTFQISRCEITRREYRYFLADPLVRLGFFGHRMQADNWDYQPLNWVEQLQTPELPVVGMDWWSAYAFANWVGGRLPTLAEWRTAASANGRHLYAWGNEVDASKQRRFTAENRSHPGVRACGTRPTDRTPDGIHDLAGNVSEWSRNIARLGDGYGVTIVGGNHLLPIGRAAKTTQHSRADPEYRALTLGLRVVRD